MKQRFNTYQLVRISLLGALLYIAQLAFAYIPGELVTLLVILYTLVFGSEALWMISVFILLEGVQWGFGLWWVSYWYVWPLLYLVVIITKNLVKEDFVIWSIVSGIYGLVFGALFAVAYIIVSPSYALTYWISGLPWDVGHCCMNFAITLLAGRPIYKLLLRLKRQQLSHSN